MFCVSLAVHAGITHTMFREEDSRIGDSADSVHVCCSERFNQLSARDGLTDAAYCLCLGMHRRSLPRRSQFPQGHSSHSRDTRHITTTRLKQLPPFSMKFIKAQVSLLSISERPVR